MTAITTLPIAEDAPQDAISGVRAAVRELLSAGMVDPYLVAIEVGRRLTPEAIHALVVELLPDLVRTEIRSLRARQWHVDDLQPSASSQLRNGKAAMGEATNDPRTWPVYVGGRWVPLGDCSAEDVLWLANDYARRASENEAQAKRYRRLAQRMRTARAATVSDLPAADLEDALAS